MINFDGVDVAALYQRVISDYECLIEAYSFNRIILNDSERVYIIQDTFVIYVGLINYGSSTFLNYHIVFEELLDNDIFKFSFNKFSGKYPTDERFHIVYKRFHGIWGELIYDPKHLNFGTLTKEEIQKKRAESLVESRADYINTKVPELQLRARYEQWEGYLYHFIIYELSDEEKTGYAIYCSSNPQIHKTAMEKANEVEECALDYRVTLRLMDKNIIGTELDFSRYRFQSEHLYQGVTCDNAMIDILLDKIAQHESNGWEIKRKKSASSDKHCIAEHDLKYFWVSRYIKSNALADALRVGAEIFKAVHNGEYRDKQRYEYLIPENKWKSEQLVYVITKSLYKKHNVLYQHRPFFLRTSRGQLSYDVFICGLNVAIEYQGKQHFEPVEIFGGEEHYKEQVYRDNLKRRLSERNGVALVYINYWEDISVDLIREKVALVLEERKTNSP